MERFKKSDFFRVDTHCDSILTVERLGIPLTEECSKRHLDFPRLYYNKINLQFFSIFIESKYKPHLSLKRTLELLEILLSQVDNADILDIIIIKNLKDLNNVIKNNKLGILISIEGGDGIESVSILRLLYRLGVRSICLTWNNRNLLADGIGENLANGGLTNFGRRIVKEMSKMGILIDVSHICEKSFWDVIKCASSPIIASHSNCYSLCEHPRNLKNEQIKAIAETEGFIGITFDIDFLGANNIKRVIDHIKYICELVGSEYVAIGSDYDGTMNIPKDLNSIEKWSNIEELLKNEGFSQKDITNILGNNVIRVLRKVLQIKK